MAKSISKNKAAGFGCVLLPFVFFVMGSVMFYFGFGRGMWKVVQARGWTPVPCTMINSEVRSYDDTYSIEVQFFYHIGDQKYEGSRYDFVDGSSSGYDSKAEIVRQIPPGSRTTCYFNPANPGEVVLERGFTGEMWFAAIPLLFAVIGLFGLYFVVQGKRNVVKAETGKADIDVVPQHGSKKGAGPVGKFIGTALVAAFWNGIVSVFVWKIVESWRSGDGEVFVTIFVTPFVIVGLVLIWSVVASFLALFNPRVIFNVIPDRVPLGGSLDLQWKWSGNTTRISQLIVRIEANEEARWRSGKNAQSERHVFFTKELLNTTSSSMIQNGFLSVRIPDDLMHSMDTGNNKIVWTVFFEGNIKNYPDVEESIEITVLPHSSRGF